MSTFDSLLTSIDPYHAIFQYPLLDAEVPPWCRRDPISEPKVPFRRYTTPPASRPPRSSTGFDVLVSLVDQHLAGASRAGTVPTLPKRGISEEDERNSLSHKRSKLRSSSVVADSDDEDALAEAHTPGKVSEAADGQVRIASSGTRSR